MKKLFLASAFCTLFLIGCSTRDEEDTTNSDANNDIIKKQEQQLKAYETTIHDQQQKIKDLEAEVLQLETRVEQVFSMEDYIIVFRGDETASFVYPTVIPYTKDQDLVETIHGFVSDGYDIGLNSYRFEDDEQLLVLDYDENANRVQGSAGTYIFLSSMKESYFANFPKLKGIKLLMNGDGEYEVIGQSGHNAIIVREPFHYEPSIEF